MPEQGKKEQNKIAETPKEKFGGQENVGGRQQGGVQGSLQGGQRRPEEPVAKPSSPANRGMSPSEKEEE